MTMTDISDRAQTGGREIRSFSVDDLELRDGDDGAVRFDGVASVVDAPYTMRDMFGEYEETIAAGAFHRTIRQKADVRMLKNHNTDFVFARTRSGTLELADDPHLRATAPSLDPSNPQVQTLRSEVSRGDVDQMSIGFRILDQEWNDDYTERTIREIELFEVSVVTFPANPATSAGIRSLDEAINLLTSAQDVPEDDLRRAIAVLTEMLPETDFEAADDDVAAALRERDIADRDRLARHIADGRAIPAFLSS